MDNKLIEVKNLKKYFPIARLFGEKEQRYVKAVDDVSFFIKEKETLGIVGESGCGKSTTGRAILRLHEPTSGEVYYKDTNICKLSQKKMREFRRNMQMVFQDPLSTLDPRYTIQKSLTEPIKVYDSGISKTDLSETISQLMETVGLPESFIYKYPHELSGGQRQRIGIARALSMNPGFIVCDEAVSALDVSIQSQIVNLFMDLQEERNISYMFISHDLSVVKYISHRICIMYLGHVVEVSSSKDMFEHPVHPYTKALISAIPSLDIDHKSQKIQLGGEIPSPINPPLGCCFHTRCKYCTEKCKTETPKMKEIEKDKFVACHLYE